MKTDNPDISSCGVILPQPRTKRVQDQTVQEWVADYDPDTALPAAENPTIEANHRFEFESYSTRTDERGSGRLLLHFYDVDTGEIIPAFFNVNITHQRGPKAGQNFKIGRAGRFWVYPKSKFAIFWLDTFDGFDEWSKVCRQLNRLKTFRFSGNVKRNKKYNQIINLERVNV